MNPSTQDDELTQVLPAPRGTPAADPDGSAAPPRPQPTLRSRRARGLVFPSWSTSRSTSSSADRPFAPAAPAEPVPLATLEGRNVSAWFGERQVLDRVSLTMPAGIITSLIGPSGC